MTPTYLDRRAFLRASLGAAGLLVVGGAGACGDGKNQNGTVLASDPVPPAGPAPRATIRLPGGDFGFPNPVAYSPPGYGRMIFVYDTLLWPDSLGTLHPWLAESYQRSPDGLAYTFVLRENVRWHDGRPFTADDVVFSFEYFAAHKATLPGFILFAPHHVAGVQAVDPRTVQVNLDKPVVTFVPSVASTFPIIPKHIWSTIAEPAKVTDLKTLVGTGAYRLSSYSSGAGSYLYEANDDFFLGAPFVERIEMRPVGDQLVALRAGEVDAAAAGGGGAPVSPAVVSRFADDPEFGVIEGPAEFPSALYWNLEKGGALGDVRFRQACALAINRPGLVERVLGGLGEPGNPGFLPPNHPYRVDVEQYRFDRGAAERLLDQAGYPKGDNGVRRDGDGKPLRFRMTALTDLSQLAQVVIADLDAVGIEVKVDPVSFLDLLSKPDYEMALLFYGGVSGDPDYMRQVYASKAEDKNFQGARGYADAELDELAEAQRVTADETERRGLIARMQEIVARDLPLLHLYYPKGVLVYRKSIFDQWSYTAEGGGPFNKQIFITGVATGGLAIRPVKEEQQEEVSAGARA